MRNTSPPVSDSPPTITVRLGVLTARLIFALASVGAMRAQSPAPFLRQQGTATQLIVDGQRFLIRGGEINNSSATNPAYLEPYWAKFKTLNLNTVLAPVYWHLIEPDEGRFDFA